MNIQKADNLLSQMEMLINHNIQLDNIEITSSVGDLLNLLHKIRNNYLPMMKEIERIYISEKIHEE